MNFGNILDYEHYAYVFLSTENQFVNYVPMSIYQFKSYHYITLNDKQNKTWDENIKSVFPSSNILNEMASINSQDSSDINNALLGNDKIPKSPTIWNITGGQRPLAIAIANFIKHEERQGDLLCYYEGNKEKIYFYESNGLLKETIHKEIDITGKLSLEETLKLRGFRCYGSKDSNLCCYHCKSNNSTCNLNQDDEQDKNYNNLFDEYINKDIFRNLIRKLNSPKLDESQKNIESINNQFPLIKINEIVSKFPQNTQLFGHILERMIYYKLKKEYSNKLPCISHSVKIDFLKGNHTKKMLDELDIVILTKQGKIKVIEVKSGDTDGDTLKSHHYSSYAIYGVYREPIFCSPIMKDEYDKKNVDNRFLQAVDHARRANLKVWFIDDIYYSKQLRNSKDLDFNGDISP